jgi:hypothetical protein
MSSLETTAGKVPTDTYKDPVKIKQEDYASVREIQVHVDTLNKYRQEIGRLTQLINNVVAETNRIETELADKRRKLAKEYNLEQIGSGQWALDFENKEFVKAAATAPVIP